MCTLPASPSHPGAHYPRLRRAPHEPHNRDAANVHIVMESLARRVPREPHQPKGGRRGSPGPPHTPLRDPRGPAGPALPAAHQGCCPLSKVGKTLDTNRRKGPRLHQTTCPLRQIIPKWGTRHQGLCPLSKVGKVLDGPSVPQAVPREPHRSKDGWREPPGPPVGTKVTVTNVPSSSEVRMTQKGPRPFWVISQDSPDHRSGLAASGARRTRDAADPNGPRAARGASAQRERIARALGRVQRRPHPTERLRVSRVHPRPNLVGSGPGTARRPPAPCDRRLRKA